MNARFRSVRGLGGKWDGKTVLTATGTGLDLLRNLRGEGSFDARAVSFGSDEFKSISGAYELSLARGVPQLSFQKLQATLGDDVYQGEGSTGADGRLTIDLSDGSRQMRMSGTVSPFQLEPVAARSPG